MLGNVSGARKVAQVRNGHARDASMDTTVGKGRQSGEDPKLIKGGGESGETSVAQTSPSKPADKERGVPPSSRFCYEVFTIPALFF